MTIDPELLALLACPRCKGAIEPSPEGNSLLCRPCRLLYRVEDGIPVMLVDEAAEWKG